MKVLLIGSGGREHAIARAISKSPKLTKLFVLPGNAGIHALAEPVSLDENDQAGITQFCQKNGIDLVVIGPESPLVSGLADALTAAKIAVFGPSKNAAKLEGSKLFTKELCTKCDIPTARYQSFTDPMQAKIFARDLGYPIVIKADGLAAGKGVVIAQSEEEAFLAIDDMLAGRFGDASKTIVIEEFLQGEELSYFAIIDGETILPFGSAQDHKRAFDGDTGPNTGGMGTYSPSPIIDDAMEQQVLEEIIKPTLSGLKQKGIVYRGVLFAGLMVTKDGPKLLEYNVRFGDPETQVLMTKLDSDLLEILHAAAIGNLKNVKVRLSPKAALCVVMASKGYPGNYAKGTEIKGLEKLSSLDQVIVYHAGTAKEEGKFLANGGRVLGITALGNTIAEAKASAYDAIRLIDWEQGFCRSDIGDRAIAKEMGK